MVTLIIPTLNEEKTIRQVIELAGKSSIVSEILVVDDKSTDDTLKVAKLESVKVYTSTKLGKGASMRDGMLLAGNEIIVYLDADILTYPSDVVERLTSPILNNEADFVKSCFDRQAGRVTELVAKPLLSILFPDLAKFSQPLSGMVAARKSFLKEIEFENDYGVDIGLLIDMHLKGARIAEVNIGYIENRMQSWDALAKMSREVSLSIIKRARTIEGYNLDTLKNMSLIRTQMDFAIRDSLLGLHKMAIFDMDNTILEDSFITTAAEAFGFKKELIKIVTSNDNAYLRTKNIAKLLKGRSVDEILNVSDSIPVIRDAEFVISELRRRGYICGIISDSYDVVTNHLKNKLGMDFSIGNELEFSKSIATGEVKVPSSFLKTPKSSCNHDFCKTNVMMQLAEHYGIDLKNIITVGDSENDICMVRDSGTGVAFMSNSKYLNLVADKEIKERSFMSLLDIAK